MPEILWSSPYGLETTLRMNERLIGACVQFFSFSAAGSSFSSLQNKFYTTHAMLGADYVLRALLQLLC